MMESRPTRHQVARGSRADARDGDQAFLFKDVLELRLTYQIRLLTFMAEQTGGHLNIVIPRTSRISGDMQAFVRQHKALVRIERAD